MDGYRSVTQRAEIKRLFTSDTDWYRAEFVTQGVWGEGYYNAITRRFVCGDAAWSQLEESSTIRFTEFGVPVKSLN